MLDTFICISYVSYVCTCFHTSLVLNLSFKLEHGVFCVIALLSSARFSVNHLMIFTLTEKTPRDLNCQPVIKLLVDLDAGFVASQLQFTSLPACVSPTKLSVLCSAFFRRGKRLADDQQTTSNWLAGRLTGMLASRRLSATGFHHLKNAFNNGH